MAAYPVGAAQRQVLNALNLTAADFTAAEQVFESIGIEVTSKRVGRSSEPVIRMKQTQFGGFNRGGDGESWSKSFTKIDLTPVQQWIVK